MHTQRVHTCGFASSRATRGGQGLALLAGGARPCQASNSACPLLLSCSSLRLLVLPPVAHPSIGSSCLRPGALCVQAGHTARPAGASAPAAAARGPLHHRVHPCSPVSWAAASRCRHVTLAASSSSPAPGEGGSAPDEGGGSAESGTRGARSGTHGASQSGQKPPLDASDRLFITSMPGTCGPHGPLQRGPLGGRKALCKVAASPSSV